MIRVSCTNNRIPHAEDCTSFQIISSGAPFTTRASVYKQEQKCFLLYMRAL